MINISASALGIMNDCGRCFYNDRKLKQKRPRGISASLPGGMDRVLKTYAEGLVADGSNKLFEDLRPWNGPEMKAWQHWRSGLTVQYKGGALITAFDFLLANSKKQFVPWDFKTKGKETTQEDAEKFYTRQLDCYDLALKKNGYETAGYGVLMYWSPAIVRGVRNQGDQYLGDVIFNVQWLKVATDHKRADKLCKEAFTLLAKRKAPAASKTCEYCAFEKERLELGRVKK